ncbi:site-2 protease family protein [Heyndrickxia oleronia]|uniref:site-2 protease family protein n=1 Tax=Heyndrickxia oleronia TaxID=38875 RepID=UPI00204006F5|nr:site-2 protease family protein [Heyndrickxia oleronia]MCI1590469.1 site-2 protease family protein [Heyndrickxia oleronia]MCI1612506.1 site-2 protease family protein [Heyndrickxia oleronia]MCI1743733.1 site-2 protease family protein [Heyndrickxia oleronia]MCI1760442.1 site-2 protease family protein [Heyndrickxia oleronia]MCM3457262.1 site-2 protease family protein [Heyndrickxia oleronia]
MNVSLVSLLSGLILYPLSTFIHELGHAFFVKLNGGIVKGIQIGIGPKVFQIGKFSINRLFFIGGLCSYEWTNQHVNNIQKFSVHIGGILFNALFIGFLFVIRIFFNVESVYIGYLNFINSLLIILCLIPMYYSANVPSDGQQLLDLFRKNK